MSTQPRVVYILPDKVGGVATTVANLLTYRHAAAFAHDVVFTHNTNSIDTRLEDTLRADSVSTVEYTLPHENLHAVMRRLAQAVPAGPGVYVASDLLDLATASVYDFGKAVVHVLHGDDPYYYDLAVKHEPIVHAYVAISRRIQERLIERMPQRAHAIFYLPHGVPRPARVRIAGAGPLRLVYAGRLENGQKGIFDLPRIDAQLRARGIARAWTIVGGGPHEADLKRHWHGVDGVRYTGPLTHDAAVDLLADHDVFVLPTRFEGHPVALLEAMGAGLVPIVSDIASGVPDVVEPGVSGMMPAVGDIAGFAAAIESLDRDRARLAAMSARAREVVATRFDVRERVAAYEALYARYAALYRPLSSAARLHYGSRLDRRWIPNSLVRLVRSAVRAVR
jgi:glycosyltransferase involved in cell wall biosynthesis